MNIVITSLLFPLIVAAVIALWTIIYRKFIEERPLLNLQISTELPAQRILPNNSHILMWRYECTLKNVSEYTARNISISEISYEGMPNLFENINKLSNIFNEQNHLEKNQELKFEIMTSHTTKPDELLKVIYENGSKVYLPGLKIPQPEKYFRPKRLDGFYLLITYHNSKGVSFYTRFKKTKEIKDNQYLRKPPKTNKRNDY
jgi:hypothetical protein